MSKKQLHTSTGRGALINPTNRFLKTEMGEDFHEFHPDEESEKTKKVRALRSKVNLCLK